MTWDDEKTDDEGLTPDGRLLASEYNALVAAIKARVLESLFDANTIIKADSDDTPAALTIAEQQLVGRITAGVITGLTATQVRTLLSVDNVENIKVNLIATVAPTVNEDSDDGYSVLSRWADVTADKEYVCLDATVGAAVWTETTGVGGGGTTITAQSFSESVAHLTTDADAGKAFTITSFPDHAQITAIRVRADWTAGQQANTGTALINDANGVSATDTEITYDNAIADFAIGDYVNVEGERIRVTADTGTVLTVVRGLKGTVASYHDDNTVLTKANHGLRLVVYTDSSMLYVEQVIELSDLMTFKGTTDASITATDVKFGLTSDMQNLGNGDFLVIVDTSDEECMVQEVKHVTTVAAEDYTIVVQDQLAAHDTSKAVEKLIIFDLSVGYSSGAGTLYCRLFVDEAITGTVNATVDVFTDSYT